MCFCFKIILFKINFYVENEIDILSVVLMSILKALFKHFKLSNYLLFKNIIIYRCALFGLLCLIRLLKNQDIGVNSRAGQQREVGQTRS